MKAADSVAFKRIYEHYSDKMFYVCLRYIRDDSDAKDVLQEGFIQAYQKIETLKEPSSFEGWLRRLMVNKCLEFLRSRSKKQEMLSEKDFAIEDETDVDLNEQDQELLREKLFSAIQDLPEGYRTVINLALVEEYSHREIAEMLDIKESTSRSQLVRARAQLKKILFTQQDSKIKQYYYG
ncbi:MAG: RNA polymerase sigma factor [Crocinitomicaceae bacterium]|nr:RNA polymerase sigma factor [Crocinitomicaceae bacterium]MDG1841198.1 RNA polymerase sigma factor [Crocinitomicaceae bacterium]